MNNTPANRGFSLVELIVSFVVVTIIGAAAWSSSSVLMQANETTRNNIIAVNLLRKSQEEVRRAAQTNFDNLGKGTCQFVNPNTCGFADVSQTFSKFDRTMEVAASGGGSSEIKQINIIVKWTTFGRDKTLTSVVLLSRPPKALPGNVVGMVRNGTAGGAPIVGVNVVLTKAAPPTTLPATSGATVTASDGADRNFTFLNPAGQFQLEAGTWTLSATRVGFLDYVDPNPVEIVSNTETRRDIPMTPAPVDATITVNLLPGGGPRGTISLYRAANLIKTVPSSRGTVFTIPFTGTDQQCFTVNTTEIFKSGFAGNFSCNPPRTQEPLGWSSAVVQADGVTLNCANPWNGSAGASVDRICVNPGDNPVVNVNLVPVATTTVSGYVRDQNGVPIPNAPIVVLWHDINTYPWPGKAATISTNAQGFYTATVPAEQSMFPNNASYYLKITASANASIQRCCDAPPVATVVTKTISVGPLFAGVPATAQDITISTALIPIKCGDAKGNVKDGPSNALLDGSTVTLAGPPKTNGGGVYAYKCSGAVPPPYSVIAADYALVVSKSGYYNFTSAGNTIYNKFTPSGKVTIGHTQTNVIGDVFLWPRGVGTIEVTTIRQGTATPVPGVTVNLSGIATGTTTTNAQGVVVFNGNSIVETWPVPGVVGNPFYNQNVRDYDIKLTHPAYEDATVADVKLTGGETKKLTVTLVPRGGM